MALFKIDGIEYNVLVKSLKRNFQVLDGENTGRNLNGDMKRDVIGTFYNYSVEIESRNLSSAQYDELYEAISSADDFHNLELPYGQNIYSFKGYISNGSDELIYVREGENKWGKLSFNMIAKSPKRRPG